MESLVLKIERKEKGPKGTVKRLRKAGFLPGVFYGKGQESQAIRLPLKEFKKLYKDRSVLNKIIQIAGLKGDIPLPAIIKELQRDAVSGEIIHVDFQYVSENKEIKLYIPVSLTGLPIGVKEQGGIVQQQLRQVHISSLPKNIPQKIVIDISALKIGNAIFLKDLKLTDVHVFHNPETVIVSVVAPRTIEEKPAETVETPLEPERIGEKKEEGEEKAAEGKEAKAPEGKEGKAEKGKSAEGKPAAGEAKADKGKAEKGKVEKGKVEKGKSEKKK